MVHRLESVAASACRRLRRIPLPALSGGIVRRYTSSRSVGAAPLQMMPSNRVRPAAGMSLAYTEMIASQRHHIHNTDVARDENLGVDVEAATKVAEAAEASGSAAKFASPKVEELFKRILWLDMVEVHLLAELINEKLGITISDAERERMSRGGGKKKEAEEEEVEEVVEEKTAFDLKLTGFDTKGKIKVIKEVRAITGMGLKDAKDLVEGVPSTIKKDIKKEAAEELKTKLEALGATVDIV